MQRIDCPACGALKAVDEEGYCNAGCGLAKRLQLVSDVVVLARFADGTACSPRLDVAERAPQDRILKARLDLAQ